MHRMLFLQIIVQTILREYVMFNTIERFFQGYQILCTLVIQIYTSCIFLMYDPDKINI